MLLTITNIHSNGWLRPFLMMKITLFLLMAVFFNVAANTGYSQQARLNLKIKDQSFRKAMREICKQSDLNFVYESRVLADVPPVSFEVSDATIYEILDVLAQPNGLEYEIEDHTVILRKAPKKEKKEIEVSGKVTDENGEGLPGATVIEVSTTNGTVTDIDGNYRISVSEGARLRFSFVGFVAQEVSMNGRQVIDMQMRPDARQLDEVVVTGYQTIAKSESTGSSQQVDNSMLDTRQAQNIFQKIEGEFAGIVLDDGKYVIRGISTLKGNTDPLVVVDGFPLDGGLDGLETINPNNVASVTVLRDAAAAAIWGVRASNGVIVITTKRGQKGQKPRIEFSSNFAITPKLNLNDLPYAPTSSLLEYEKHVVDIMGDDFSYFFDPEQLSKSLKTYSRLNAGEITQSEADASIGELEKVDSREEFSRLFMGNPYWQQYNLAISGGGQYNTYRASVTYNINENTGSFVGNNSDQLQTTFNSSVNLMPKLTLETDVNFNKSNTKNNGMSFSDFEGISQYQRILDEEGNYVPQLSGGDFNQDFKQEKINQGFPYSDWDYNLKQEFDNKNNSSASTILRMQGALEYDIIEGLSIRGSYQYQWKESETNNLFNENTYRVRDLVNRFTYLDPQTNELTSAYPKGHILEQSYIKGQSYDGRLQLNFNRSFLQDRHRVSVVAGYERRQEISNVGNFTRFGYDPQTLLSANVPFGTRVRTANGFESMLNNPDNSRHTENEDRFISSYSTVNYTYLGKYSLSASARLDDTDLFGANNKYRNIPLTSIGGRWKLSQERFMRATSSFLDQLSLRVAYGSKGNIFPSSSPFLVIFSSINPLTNIPYATLEAPKNLDLRFEKTFTANYGADFGLWGNRVAGSIGYYERKSKDLLESFNPPPSLGYERLVLNLAGVENKGVDITLNLQAVQAKAFSYSTIFNFSYNKNVIVQVDTVAYPKRSVKSALNGNVFVLKKPINLLYSYQWRGLDSEGYPQIQNKDGELINYRGETADGERADLNITRDDLLYNGTTTPSVYGSWINELRYKGFFLRAMMTFKFGHVFRNTNILDYPGLSDPQVGIPRIHKDFASRWKAPGDEEQTTIPRLFIADNDTSFDSRPIGYTYYPKGSQWVDTASIIRLREVVFGYGFSNKLLGKISMQSLLISLQTRNLGFIAFNKWKIDPENVIRPLQPDYTLNLTASF